MKILLINHYAGSDEHGMEFRPYYLAKEWVKLGHTVTVVAATYSHLRTNNKKINKDYEEENINGINFLWFKTDNYVGNGLSRLKNTIQFSRKLYKYSSIIADKYKPDVIIASSPHVFIAFGAKKLSKMVNRPFIFEVRDLWPLSMIKLHDISPKHPLMLVMQYAENYAYRNADGIASVLPYATEYYRAHGSQSPIEVFPNAINLESWDTATEKVNKNISKMLIEMKENGFTIIGYTGTVGVANAIDVLIESARELKNQKIKIIIVGDGDQLVHLKDVVQREDLNQIVKFIPKIAKQEIPNMLSYFDAVYLGWKKSDLYDYGVSPNKLMDYMMAKKLIIHSISTQSDLVQEYNCGLTVPAENPKVLAEAISKIAALSKEERETLGNNGYVKVLQNHTYQNMAKKYVEFIQKLKILKDSK